MLKKLFYAAGIYAALGLAGGLFYRTLTHAQDFTGPTQLAVVHTHLLVLGMIFMLLLLALEKVFDLSRQRSFNVFFWLYNVRSEEHTSELQSRGHLVCRLLLETK